MSPSKFEEPMSIDSGNLDPFMPEREGIFSCIAGLALVPACSGADALQKVPETTVRLGRKMLDTIGIAKRA